MILNCPKLLLITLVLILFPMANVHAKNQKLILLPLQVEGNVSIQAYATETEESVISSVESTKSSVQFPHAFNLNSSKASYYKKPIDTYLKGKKLPYSSELLSKLSKELEMQTLYFGTLTQKDQQLSITLNEFDASTGTLKQLPTIQEPLSNLFDLHYQLASQIILRQITEMNSAMKTELKKHTHLTTNMKAYESYLKGKEAYNQQQLNEAYQHFTRAIELDPKFAYAYLYRGMTQEYSGKPIKANEDFNIICKMGYQTGCIWLNR